MFGSVASEKITRISLNWGRCAVAQRLVPGSVPDYVTITWVCRQPKHSGSKEAILVKITTQTAEVHLRDFRNS